VNKRLDLMAKLASDVLEVPSDTVVNEATPLDPWDSLCIMGALATVDDIYGKVLSGAALQECKTIGDVLNLAEA
jgi:acyl carrier protein